MKLLLCYYGLSYHSSYKHRKYDDPISLDMNKIHTNNYAKLIHPLSQSHQVHIAISTNMSHMLHQYLLWLAPVFVDTEAKNERERIANLMRFAMKGAYDAVVLTRCDLMLKCSIEHIHIDWTKANFAFRQVNYTRWKKLKFRKIPIYNKTEVCNVFSIVPFKLFCTFETAYRGYIDNDMSHHVAEHLNANDVHFMIDDRYQSNCDIVQNPIYTFTRTLDLGLVPELHHKIKRLVDAVKLLRKHLQERGSIAYS